MVENGTLAVRCCFGEFSLVEVNVYGVTDPATSLRITPGLKIGLM